MKVKRIIIDNYRSFGKEKNYITMTDDIIAIVGKNDSGKTNFLKALDGMQFFKTLNLRTLNCCNYFIKNDSVRISIIVEIYPEDYQKISESEDLLPVAAEQIFFDFTKLNDYGYFMTFHRIEDKIHSEDSYFSRVMKRDQKLSDCFTKLLAVAKKEDPKNLNENDRSIWFSLVYWAEYYATTFFKFDYNWLGRYRSNISETEIAYIRNNYEKFMANFATIMPQIFTYNDDNLSDSYKREDLERENRKFFNTPSSLEKLISALDETPKSFLQALGNQSSMETLTVKRRYERKLKIFNEDFNCFYNKTQENIELNLNFDHEQCVIHVSNGDSDTTFKFSERSNGLKWYLGFFAALRSAKIHKSALMLIDEPAVHLHVDAQKEVLSLFDNLSENGHQVIYTTHSPAMLDINKWERIRTIEKQNDISYIFMPHESHKGEKHLETLSPIQQAMGCCLKNTLAPDANRLNLIVEGIIDYYYIKAMLKACGIPDNDQPYLIPACSVDNIPNIVAILFGWGYRFCVLLDNDPEGEKVKQRLHNGCDESVKKYIFQVSNKVGDVVEDLLSSKDRDKFRKINKSGGVQKTISAHIFMCAVLKEGYSPEKETIDKFKELFSRLGLISSLTLVH